MNIEGWAIVLSILGGFTIHIFYFGRGLGEMKGEVKHLAKSIDELKEKHYLPRDEFEARHQELRDLVDKFIMAVKANK